MTHLGKTGRKLTLILRPVLALLVACSVTDFACTQTGGARPVYSVEPRRVPLIEPGTVVGSEAPQGWSHLVIKSYPHPALGDVDRLNETSTRLASFIIPAFLANVKGENINGQTRYRLDNVAVGLATKINDKDVIITPKTQKNLGANLGLLQRTVFNRAFELQQEVYLVARSDTMMLIDTYAALRRNGKNRQVVLRYALLADPATGRLDNLVWGIDKDGEGRYAGAFGDIEWLPKNKISDAKLYVDGDEFTVGIPSENAFAIVEPPKGQKQIAIPEELKTIAGSPKLTADAAYQLEMKLRQALAQAAAAK